MGNMEAQLAQIPGMLKNMSTQQQGLLGMQAQPSQDWPNFGHRGGGR